MAKTLDQINKQNRRRLLRINSQQQFFHFCLNLIYNINFLIYTFINLFKIYKFLYQALFI
jgi:hypothetical protein